MTPDRLPLQDSGQASPPSKSAGAGTPQGGEPPKAQGGEPPKAQGGAAAPKTSADPGPSPRALRSTRAASAWLATAAALVLLVLLIILILQNQNPVKVHYLGLSGSLQLGTALVIAAVAGASVVTIVGVVRLTQLRFTGRRARRAESGHAKKKP